MNRTVTSRGTLRVTRSRSTIDGDTLGVGLKIFTNKKEDLNFLNVGHGGCLTEGLTLNLDRYCDFPILGSVIRCPNSRKKRLGCLLGFVRQTRMFPEVKCRLKTENFFLEHLPQRFQYKGNIEKYPWLFYGQILLS